MHDTALEAPLPSVAGTQAFARATLGCPAHSGDAYDATDTTPGVRNWSTMGAVKAPALLVGQPAGWNAEAMVAPVQFGASNASCSNPVNAPPPKTAARLELVG